MLRHKLFFLLAALPLLAQEPWLFVSDTPLFQSQLTRCQSLLQTPQRHIAVITESTLYRDKAALAALKMQDIQIATIPLQVLKGVCPGCHDLNHTIPLTDLNQLLDSTEFVVLDRQGENAPWVALCMKGWLERLPTETRQAFFALWRH